MSSSWLDGSPSDSMPDVVFAGVSALAKLATSKKHAHIRQECASVARHIQEQTKRRQEDARASGGHVFVDTDANPYFLLLKLTCDTGVSKLMCLALDIMQRLVAFGYMDGAAPIDTRLYGNPNPHMRVSAGRPRTAADSAQADRVQAEIAAAAATDGTEPTHTNGHATTAADSSAPLAASDFSLTAQSASSILSGFGSDGRLIAVMIDTLYQCSGYKDQQVQLLVLRCLLTCITSPSCSVHGWSLLQSVSACFQIYLANPAQTNNAGEEINRVTAKATLTQICNIVFQRMEHFAQQLRQINAMQQQMQLRAAAAANGTEETETPTTDASVSPAITPSPESNHVGSSSAPPRGSVSGPTLRAPVPAGTPPGRRGFCVWCGRPANHYCIVTRLPVCTTDCKLNNLSRQDPTGSLTSHLIRDGLIQLELSQNDSFYLLRALCRLSIKILPPTAGTDKSDASTIAVDSKILSLQLLLSVLSHAGPTFRTTKHLIACVQSDLVNCVLRNSAASSIDAIFALSSSLFVSMVCHFKPHLHAVIGPVLDSIYLPYIASPNSTFELKLISLTVLHKLALDPQTLIEIFINYDCDTSSIGHTFQKMAATLEKVCRSRFVSENWLSAGEEARLRLIALEGLVDTIKSLLTWTRRAQANLIAAKDAADAALSGAAPTAVGDAAYDSDDESIPASENSARGKSQLRSGPSASTPSNAVTPVNGDDGTLAPSFSMQQFHALRAQKQHLDTGILKFNMRPKKGLAYLHSHGLLDAESPAAVAEFFLANAAALDKVQVGEFMGAADEFHKAVFYNYTERLDFHSMAFDEAIRRFLDGFWLPGEAQQIDRMMEKFAEQYHRHNPGVFSTADTAYVLAYSVILLNTDAHSANVKYRMTKEDFFKNCRGIDDGKDIPPAFLGEIYDRITIHEIKMKDDPYRRSGGAAKEVMKRDRINMFVAESQELVKRTQDYLDNFQRKQAETTLHGDARRSSTEDGITVDASRRRLSNEAENSSVFQQATDADIEAVRPMFEILWYSSLATFSVLLEENEGRSDDNAAAAATQTATHQQFRIVELCLDGYRHSIRLSSALGIETSRLAFVTSLRKFTLLGSSREMKLKNIEAIKMLLLISHTEGNHLRDSWMDVLQCISELERLHLFANSRPIADVFQSSPMRTRESDSINSVHVNKIDASAIDRVFTSSAHLDSDAIVDFVQALRIVSEQELSNVSAPRVFSLQKIVEITYYNMGRIRVVWTKIWGVLSTYFIQAGCHPNLNVSMYAIDSLRQLAMKFLEKDELASFQFQKQFFRPFELIMIQNASNETRELIVQCMHRMVASRVHNIKSGWKGVFVVIHTAASQTYQPLVVAGFELLATIMDQHFSLLTSTTDTMDECVNCLVAFGCNNFTAISLKAIQYLNQCCDYLGAQQVMRRETIAAKVAQSESAGTPVRSRGTSVAASAGTPTDLNVSLPGSPTPSVSGSEDDLDTGLLSPSTSAATMQMDLKIWFLALTGLSRMVLDQRLEVRSRALLALFKILAVHGTHFSPSTWRAVFFGVLFPLFDDVRHSSDPQKKRVHPSGSSESSTPVAREDTRAWTGAQQPSAWRNPNNWSWPAGASTTKAVARNSMPNGTAGQTTPSGAPVPTVRAIPALPPKPPTAPTARMPSMPPPPVPIPAPRPPHSSSTRSSAPPPSAENSWLQTTCFSALSTLVELFDHFYPSVSFMLGDLLELIHSCISQESEDLARIGIRCLTMLLTKVGPKLSIASWWVALESMAEVVQRTMPVEIMSHKTRVILGLVEADATERTDASETNTREGSRAGSRRNSGATESAPVAPAAPVAVTTTNEVSSEPTATSNDAAPSLPPMIPPSSPMRLPPSLSPLPPPTPGATAVLPFASHVVVGKFRVQLQLAEAISDITEAFFPTKALEQERERGAIAHTKTTSMDKTGAELDFLSESDELEPPASEVVIATTEDQVLGSLTCEQLFFALDVMSSTLSFARAFNLDLALRRKLYTCGFQTEQTVLGRLPQLFLQETRATRLYMNALARLIREGGADESPAHEQATMDGERWMQMHRDAGDAWSEEDLLSGHTPMQPSYESYVRLSESRFIGLALRFLADYATKTVSGQLVSLEFSDELICAFIEQLQQLAAVSTRRFQNYMSIFYMPLVQLISIGKETMRQHLGKLFHTAVVNLLPFAPITPFATNKI